jgi:ADP-ribosyl-[dinitrogen reductase] hydrolase
MQKERNSDTHPITIDFLNYKWAGSSAQLGITFAPGKKQEHAMTGSWNRDLAKDVDRIANYYKINTLVSMVELEEMRELSIEAEFEECKKRGIETFHFPVEDNNIPSDVDGFVKLAKEIVDNHLRKDRSVVVHCKGGLGRAPTLVLACLLYSKVSF